MNTTKSIILAVVLFSTSLNAMADRGVGKRSKNKITLNISTPALLRNSVSLNLKYGLKYTGSIMVYKPTGTSSAINNTLVTYQKGNTVYIIPYKQKVIMPEIKPGYAGMKFIIRQH